MITKTPTQLVNGAKAIIQTLQDFGTEVIFGYPGGVVLELYDELYKQEAIKHVLVRHEQSAVHAAEGYARATGKCGVVFVTSGPGVTNTLTGIANAYLDSFPLIIITAHISKSTGHNAFQEVDICSMTKSRVKAAFRVDEAKEIQQALSKAFEIANSGKKGPVVVDIAKDLFRQSIKYVAQTLPISTTDYDLPLNSCQEILEELQNSLKPVIVVGGGVKHSYSEKLIHEFAKKTSIPVVSTMMGLGCFPYEDENYFGMIGMYGDKAANELVKQADKILSLGARWNDRITYMFDKDKLGRKLLKVDINPDEINGMVSQKLFVNGDIYVFIADLLHNLSKYNLNFRKWLKYSQNFKQLNAPFQKKSNMLHSFEVMQEIEAFTHNKQVTFTTEVGQHQIFALRSLKFNSERKIFASGGLGAMGFGLPAAIGAAVANPEQPVVCISGDGSFQMNLHELATCKDYSLNIKIMIFNNGYLGMVRQLQESRCDNRYSETKISNPDFVKLAQSYGIESVKVTSREKVKPALEKAFSTDKTFILVFEVEPTENI